MQVKAITLLLAAGAAMAQSTLQVNTPTGSVLQCVPLQLTFSGGQPPYTITVNSFDGSMASGLLDTIGNVNSSPYSYTPREAVGTRLQFDVIDSTGARGQSGGTPAIAAGPNSSCVGGSASGSSSAAAGSTGAASASSGASSAASSASGAASSAASSASSRASSATGSAASSASSAAATARPSSNAATNVRGVAGAVAGVVGMAAAALF